MPQRQREPLTRAHLLQAAVALADRDGLGAVSMRRLSETLGVVPMALYKHVADKDDLIDGMVDAVIGEFSSPVPQEDADWKAAIRHAVMSARTAVHRHPWARRAIETRTVRTPAVLGHMETLTQILLRGGLSPDLTHHAMHVLGNRIWGFSPELFNDPDGPPATTRRRTSGTPDPADYPAIMAVTADATERRPGATGCDEEFEFRFALDLVLEGLARLQQAGWSSTSTD